MGPSTGTHDPAPPNGQHRNAAAPARGGFGGSRGVRLQRRSVWVRVLTVVGGVVYAVVAFFALGFFGVPSGFHGWLPAALGYLPGLLLITVGIGLGRWPVAVVWAVAAALLLGGWAYRQAPPIHERIEAVAADVSTPSGWTTIDDGSWTGGTWGLFGSWPEVTYTYATPDAPRVAADAYAARLEEAGWEHQTSHDGSPSGSPGVVAQAWTKGRWTVEVRVAGAQSQPREFDTVVPDALTRVDLYFDGQG